MRKAMIRVGAVQARKTWSTLLDRVDRGEAIIITRRGKPVAQLVPDSAVTDPSQVQAALQRMRACSGN
jgi:prevent-host-death family protein